MDAAEVKKLLKHRVTFLRDLVEPAGSINAALMGVE